MQIADAVRAIAEFWEGGPLPWAGGGEAYVGRLERQFGAGFPVELRTYIRDFAPKRRLTFECIGNPCMLYGMSGEQRLGFKQPGYSWNPLTGEDIEDWDHGWFLIADEGADPIIVDLSRGDTEIWMAWHGQGAWSFFPVADSIGQFLLGAAAVDRIAGKLNELRRLCERGLATQKSIRALRAELKGFARSRIASPTVRDRLEADLETLLEELSEDLRLAKSADSRFRLFVEDWVREIYRTVRAQPRFNDAFVGGHRDREAVVVTGSVPSERALRDLRAIVDGHPPGVEVVWKVAVRPRKPS
jgi:hypothetical protein